MYVAVAVGSIQVRSRFTVAEGELRSSIVAEEWCYKVGRILDGLKILSEWCPCLTNQIYFSY